MHLHGRRSLFAALLLYRPPRLALFGIYLVLQMQAHPITYLYIKRHLEPTCKRFAVVWMIDLREQVGFIAGVIDGPITFSKNCAW